MFIVFECNPKHASKTLLFLPLWNKFKENFEKSIGFYLYTYAKIYDCKCKVFLRVDYLEHSPLHIKTLTHPHNSAIKVIIPPQPDARIHFQ